MTRNNSDNSFGELDLYIIDFDGATWDMRLEGHDNRSTIDNFLKKNHPLINALTPSLIGQFNISQNPDPSGDRKRIIMSGSARSHLLFEFCHRLEPCLVNNKICLKGPLFMSHVELLEGLALKLGAEVDTTMLGDFSWTQEEGLNNIGIGTTWRKIKELSTNVYFGEVKHALITLLIEINKQIENQGEVFTEEILEIIIEQLIKYLDGFFGFAVDNDKVSPKLVPFLKRACLMGPFNMFCTSINNIYKLACRPFLYHPPCRFLSYHHKIHQVFILMHAIAQKYPNKKITFNFLDDWDRNLNELYRVFSQHSEWIPKNMTLVINELILGKAPQEHFRITSTCNEVYTNWSKISAVLKKYAKDMREGYTDPVKDLFVNNLRQYSDEQIFALDNLFFSEIVNHALFPFSFGDDPHLSSSDFKDRLLSCVLRIWIEKNSPNSYRDSSPVLSAHIDFLLRKSNQYTFFEKFHGAHCCRLVRVAKALILMGNCGILSKEEQESILRIHRGRFPSLSVTQSYNLGSPEPDIISFGYKQ